MRKSPTSRESAPAASTFGAPIADRISAWLTENPDATEYAINTELEARELLITIAAAIKLMIRDMEPSHEKDCAKVYERQMRAAAFQKRGLAYIRENFMAEGCEALEFLGVRITVDGSVH